jgi:hypothetical protein
MNSSFCCGARLGQRKLTKHCRRQPHSSGVERGRVGQHHPGVVLQLEPPSDREADMGRGVMPSSA